MSNPPPPLLSSKPPPPPPLHKQNSLSTDFCQEEAWVRPPPPRLPKQKSLCTDFCREEAWLRRKDNHRQQQRHRRTKSLITTEDIDELKGCVDLGFRFTTEPTGLSKTFPALDLYYATSSSPPTPCSSSGSSSYGDSPPQPCSPAATGAATTTTLFNSGDNPEMVKRKLKQWAQVVSCAARQPSCYQAYQKN